MSGVNEIRFLFQHKLCDCKWEFNGSACNSKQKWNHDEYRCECKELDDRSSFKDDDYNLNTTETLFNDKKKHVKKVITLLTQFH